MYITNIVIKNIGSIKNLKIIKDNLFKIDGSPKPIILLGKNGSGKTTLLSSIADAFFELANKSFEDVLPKNGAGYSYYKISGGTTRLNTKFGFTYIQFKQNEKEYEYIDKSGDIDFKTCKENTGNLLKINNNWDTKGNHKNVTNTKNDENFKNDFQKNSYCFFPSDRFEYPHWINRETISKNPQFSNNLKFNNKLNKSFIARRSLDQIKNWILDIFLDSRADIIINPQGKLSMKQNAQNILLLQKGKQNIEEILSDILGEKIELNVNIRGQENSRLKIVNKITQEDIIPSLDHLSAGQSTLLSIFASIIKLSDSADVNKSINLTSIEGIILIDEIDLHLHIELQKDVLPNLISKFPKIQFIISSHSPFFLRGMSEKFGENLLLLNMPDGNQLNKSDDFEEFEKAFDIFEGLTNNYKKELDELKIILNNTNNTIIFCEGETDPEYIKKAKELLNKNIDIDIQWIGIKTGNNNSFSGTSALDQAKKFLEANPNLFKNNIILLYDCDEKQKIKDEEFNKDVLKNLFVRRIPYIIDNPIKKGIENLFPKSTIDKVRNNDIQKIKKRTEEKDGKEIEFFEVSNGKKISLQKWICSKGNKEDFTNFNSIFKLIEEILKKETKKEE